MTYVQLATAMPLHSHLPGWVPTALSSGSFLILWVLTTNLHPHCHIKGMEQPDLSAKIITSSCSPSPSIVKILLHCSLVECQADQIQFYHEINLFLLTTSVKKRRKLIVLQLNVSTMNFFQKIKRIKQELDTCSSSHSSATLFMHLDFPGHNFT